MLKNSITSFLFFIFTVIFSNVYAVAPRISQDMFEQNANVDVMAYESVHQNEKNLAQLSVELVNQSLAIENVTLNIDVVPSKQLAIYALFNGDVIGLIGKKSDLTGFDDASYFKSVFYLHADGEHHKPIAFFIDKNAPDAEQLFSIFKQGLNKLIDNETYADIIKKSGAAVVANYRQVLNDHGLGD